MHSARAFPHPSHTRAPPDPPLPFSALEVIPQSRLQWRVGPVADVAEALPPLALHHVVFVNQQDGVVRLLTVASAPDAAAGGEHTVLALWEASFESMTLHPVFKWTGVAPQREVGLRAHRRPRRLSLADPRSLWVTTPADVDRDWADDAGNGLVRVVGRRR